MVAQGNFYLWIGNILTLQNHEALIRQSCRIFNMVVDLSRDLELTSTCCILVTLDRHLLQLVLQV